MLATYAITLFLSATLLFLVQPMFAKMVLPLVGGAPAVWNTCIVFFQATLLAGYAYAHAATRHLGIRRHSVLHIALLFLPLVILPVQIPANWAPPVDHNPIRSILFLALVSVGLPFFVLATTAPLLQRWFAHTRHRSAGDPYFLYAASNAGSIAALLSYPVLVEPNLQLGVQSRTWSVGYGLFVVCAIGCAAVLWRSQIPSQTSDEPVAGGLPVSSSGAHVPPAWRDRLAWTVLAFVPSSLLLGVTTYLATDIPPIPLLWVVPLAIYLATFVMVFARTSIVPHRTMIKRLPFLVLLSAISIFLRVTQPSWILVPLHLLTFFVAAMVCHGELAARRPAARYLTGFYMWMSFGGVLGGLFNALIAPVLFDNVVEYPLALILACLLRPVVVTDRRPRARWLDLALPAAVGLMTAGMLAALPFLDIESPVWLQLLVFGPPAMICLSFSPRPLRFALGLAAMMVASLSYAGPFGRPLLTDRSFFGVYRVTRDPGGRFHLLLHGSTVHGAQRLDPARRLDVLTYYSRTGPLGQFFSAFPAPGIARRVGLIGLGTGVAACYGRTGDRFTFFEIDPMVERIARDARYFTFLRDCPPSIDVVLGDARLSLEKVPERHYDLIVLDAFSSDVIPVHLVTREALELYLSKLDAGGVLLLNISNRYLNLQPVIADLARDLGLICLVNSDTAVSAQEMADGKYASQWAVLARQSADVDRLSRDAGWMALSGRPGARVWTDNFSNVLSVLSFR